MPRFRQLSLGCRCASLVMLLSIVGIIAQDACAHNALLQDETTQSAEQSPQWKSRRAPGKWIPVSGMEEKPVPSGKVTDKAAKSSRGASAPSIAGRKSPSMVFIAGKSAQQAESNENGTLASLDEHGRSENMPDPIDASHSGHAENRDDAVEHDGSTQPVAQEHADSHGHDHAEQPAEHPSTYFDTPAFDSSDTHTDAASDGAPVISSTERVKQMLQRHAELEKVSSGADQSSQKKDAVNADEKKTISTLPPSIEADLRSEDPMRREHAKRFLRLREQLLQLKARPRPATPSATQNTPSGHTTNGATHKTPGDAHSESAHSEPQPSATDSSHSEHPTTDAGHSGAEHHDSAHEDRGHAEGGHEKADHGDSHGDSDHATADKTGANDGHSNHPADSHEPASHASGEHGSAEHGSAEHDASGDEGHSAETHEEVPDDHAAAGSHDVHLTAGSISDPIDRVSLGNNLYALGEYPAAHQAYLSVDPEELSAEQQFWTEYQIANCLRRMGENAEASNRFRKIAAQPEAGWLSERAAWWVGVLEQMRKAEAALTSEAAPNQGTKANLPISGSPKEETHDNAHH